ncbi:GNAT family N-acetyltransferase [Vineibacter terrae]|uniref:GNAT family N-acetyltransferase n=2 Tax=Vineibacter terrae TaxID=2586908 RepID=A0A5C8PT46_9HYPH|nr:GNAT family N-acetyltransferase [Vineibacter terrae]
MPASVRVRAAEAADLPAIVALDQRITGVAKAGYWQWALEHYAAGPPERTFLIAESADGALAGFIIGEVRAWEFGAPPAGWVFAVQVDQTRRLGGVGTQLFDTLCARFRAAGVDRVRTLVDRRDHLILSFFRSQGMTAGPSLQLDLELLPPPTSLGEVAEGRRGSARGVDDQDHVGSPPPTDVSTLRVETSYRGTSPTALGRKKS